MSSSMSGGESGRLFLGLSPVTATCVTATCHCHRTASDGSRVINLTSHMASNLILSIDYSLLPPMD
jgi:hypothetical protein